MSLPILGANTLSAAGFNVANSCQFDGSSDYLHRTLGTPTNNKIWTFSCWFKVCQIGEYDQYFFNTYETGYSRLYIKSSNSTLELGGADDGSGNAFILNTNMVFKDTSAWYHVCVAWDVTQSTASDRCKIYINGAQITSWNTETYPGQNVSNYTFNSAVKHWIGRYKFGSDGTGSYWWDGYLAELVIIDGQALAPTSFGEYDSDSPNIWKPIDVSGLTPGTNGTYLDFEDSSNLGNDAFGGTDWTEVGLAAADQAVDSPTNNFCVMNLLDNFYAAFTFSIGNCKLVNSTKGFATGTFGLSAGKWYWEVKPSAGDGAYYLLGIADLPTAGTGASNYLGYTSGEQAYYAADGAARTNQNSPAYGDTYAADDIIGIYLDLDNSKLYFAKNGTVQNSGTGIDITAVASTTNGVYFPATGYNDASAAVYEHNFGGCSAFAISSGNTDANGYGNFEYDPSAGTFDSASKSFLALCTKNLAENG